MLERDKTLSYISSRVVGKRMGTTPSLTATFQADISYLFAYQKPLIHLMLEDSGGDKNHHLETSSATFQGGDSAWTPVLNNDCILGRDKNLPPMGRHKVLLLYVSWVVPTTPCVQGRPAYKGNRQRDS